MRALEADDAIVATYREHGHALARGVSMRSIMAEMFGRAEGCSGGRGGSMHLFDAGHPLLRRQRHRRRRPAGGRRPGAGRPPGRAPNVTACFFGEGAVAEGEFHESMNLAALWDLPVLFCCENNLYAMGTALDRSESETDLALKAAAYEMPAWPVDGMDVLAVRARGPSGRRRDPGRRRSRASWSCAPTGSAPTRCTTPSATATRPRSSSGRSGTRSPRSPTRSAPTASSDGDGRGHRDRGGGRARRRRRLRPRRHARTGRPAGALRGRRGGRP